MRNLLKIMATVFFLGFIFVSQNSQAVGEDFSITLVPPQPSAGQKVTAKISTFSFDSDRSRIDWVKNGTLLAGGIGKKNIEFTMPSLGKSSQLVVYVTTGDGISVSKTLILRGNDIDLLWEADAYTPYWYKGKALATIDSTVKITAIPYLFSTGTKISSSNLVYEWFLDYKKDHNQSGTGKNSFVFSVESRSGHTATVKITNLDKTVNFEKSIKIGGNDTGPEIIFYEFNLLSGTVLNQALQNFYLTQETINVKAEPYFFSNDSNLSYKWQMNGKEIVPDKPDNTTFRRPEDSAGVATVKVNIQNQNIRQLNQLAEKELKISF